MKRHLLLTALCAGLALLVTGCFDLDPGGGPGGGGGYAAPAYGYAPAAAPAYYNNRTVYRPVYRTVIRQPVVRRRK